MESRFRSQHGLTKYMNNTAAEPPNIQLTIRASPIKRFGRLDGGGWGYVRGGMAGAAGMGWRGPLNDVYPMTLQAIYLPLSVAVHLSLLHSNPYHRENDVSQYYPRSAPGANAGMLLLSRPVVLDQPEQALALVFVSLSLSEQVSRWFQFFWCRWTW